MNSPWISEFETRGEGFLVRIEIQSMGIKSLKIKLG